jgi:DNA-binding transcriptional regulator YiaG
MPQKNPATPLTQVDPASPLFVKCAAEGFYPAVSPDAIDCDHCPVYSLCLAFFNHFVAERFEEEGYMNTVTATLEELKQYKHGALQLQDAFGLQVKIARLKTGKSKTMLAHRLSVSPSWLSKIETGKGKPGPQLRAKLKRFIKQAKIAFE